MIIDYIRRMAGGGRAEIGGGKQVRGAHGDP
jgi:hypothetical protein